MTYRTVSSLKREAEALAVAIRALEWYGDQRNWVPDAWGVPSVVDVPDYGIPGNKARRALKKIDRMLEPTP